MQSNSEDLSVLISDAFQNNGSANVILVLKTLLCFICCLKKDMVLYIESYEEGSNSMFGWYFTYAGKCFPCLTLVVKPCQLGAFVMNKPENIQYKSSFWYFVDSIFELDIFLNTNCLNLDLLLLLYTLMLSLNIAASNNFGEEISSLIVGGNIENYDLGVSLKIIPMTWVVFAPVVVSSLWSKLSAMNCQNLFCDSISLSVTK